MGTATPTPAGAKQNYTLPWLAITALIFGANASAGATEVDVGKTAYEAMCASCHAIDGRGAGPMREQLNVEPSDLTVLAKKNGGVFPVKAVYEAIDGRKVIAAHGTREMPIWGVYSPKLLYPMDKLIDQSYDPEAESRARILATIDYLNRIQEK